MQSEYILVANFILQVFTAICYYLIAPWAMYFFFAQFLKSSVCFFFLSSSVNILGHTFLTCKLKIIVMTIFLRNAGFTIINPFTDHFNNTSINTKMLLYGVHTIEINCFLRSLVNCFHAPSVFMIISRKAIITIFD